MKKIFFITMVFCQTISIIINAQNFQKAYSGKDLTTNNACIITYDNGYLMAGSGMTKTDSLGNIEWAKNYDIGVLVSQGYFYAVKETNDSGFIAAGRTHSSGAGGHDIYVVKTDKYGDTIWTKTYGGLNSDEAFSIEYTKDNGYIITGLTESYGAGLSDIYVIRINSSGDTIWTRTFGGIKSDNGKSIKMTSDSNYVITGAIAQNFYDNVCLIKINPNGDTLWTRIYGGSTYDWAKDVIETNDGGYAIIGSTVSYAVGGIVDVYFIKTDSLGYLQWSKTYGDSYGDEGYIVRQTYDNGYIIAGRMQSNNIGGEKCTPSNPCYNVYLIRTDSVGDTLWTKMYGGIDHDFAYALEITSDSGFIITGQSGSFNVGSLPLNVYMIKTDKYGNTLCNCFPTNTIVSSPSTLTYYDPIQISSGCIVKGAHSGVGNIQYIQDSSLCANVGLPHFDLKQAKINIYPNPTTGIIKINHSGIKKDFILSIQNILGQEIIKPKLIFHNQNNLQFDLSSQLKGIYFIKLANKDFVKVEKVVLQ